MTVAREILTDLKRSLYQSGCEIYFGVDRSVDDPLKLIHDWKGLTLVQCKTLAASTVGTADRTSWTYKTSFTHVKTSPGILRRYLHTQCVVEDAGFHDSSPKHQSGTISGQGCGTGMSSGLLRFFLHWPLVCPRNHYFSENFFILHFCLFVFLFSL